MGAGQDTLASRKRQGEHKDRGVGAPRPGAAGGVRVTPVQWV